MNPQYVAAAGIATFIVALSSGVTADATWHSVFRPGLILPALGQVGGLVLTYLGARRMDPPVKGAG